MSVYKVIEIIGTSTESWEDAGLTAVKKARETIRNLRPNLQAIESQLARRGTRV